MKDCSKLKFDSIDKTGVSITDLKINSNGKTLKWPCEGLKNFTNRITMYYTFANEKTFDKVVL
ncbi:hypothetical protein, partial [Desulfatiferula olefinivorans]